MFAFFVIQIDVLIFQHSFFQINNFYTISNLLSWPTENSDIPMKNQYGVFGSRRLYAAKRKIGSILFDESTLVKIMLKEDPAHLLRATIISTEINEDHVVS